MKLNEAVSARIVEIMKERGLNSHALSVKVGMASSSIDDILKCKYETVKLNSVYDILAGLDLDIEIFFSSPLFKRENITD